MSHRLTAARGTASQRGAFTYTAAARRGEAAAKVGVDDEHRSRPIRRASEFDDEPELAWRKWTRAEAEALRVRSKSVSPWRVVAAQAVVGLLCALLGLLLTQSIDTFWSALYGAAVAVIPSALLARGMTRGTRGAVATTAGFMFWESVKVGVAIAMLIVAVKVVPRLSWPALLATMVVCIKINWLALLWRGR